MWLQFKAAKDLLEKGKVEHLDVEEVVNQYFGDFEVVHKERKNLGRTYVYILKKSAVDKAVDVCQAI